MQRLIIQKKAIGVYILIFVSKFWHNKYKTLSRNTNMQNTLPKGSQKAYTRLFYKMCINLEAHLTNNKISVIS